MSELLPLFLIIGNILFFTIGISIAGRNFCKIEKTIENRIKSRYHRRGMVIVQLDGTVTKHVIVFAFRNGRGIGK